MVSGPARGIPALVLVKKSGALASARTAYLPWEPRTDLRLLVPIATRTWALAVPTVLTVAAGLLYLSGTKDMLSAYFYSAMLSWAPFSMGAPFIAGVIAPRAGWLVGVISALIAWLVTAVVLLLTPVAESQAGDRNSLIAVSLFSSLWAGALIGAFAAWYRRVLKLTSPAPRPSGRGGRPQKARPARQR